MRVEVVHVGGRYAQRVTEFLASRGAGDVSWYVTPRALPPIIDDPEEYLPPGLGQAEIIVAINLHPDLLLEIACRVGEGTLRALIAPIEDPSWVKPGLQRQVTQACAARGIESAFPKPFCALVPSTPTITEFCDAFGVGLPDLDLTIEGGRVAAVTVRRGSPCGLTRFVAEGLIGRPADDTLPEAAGQLHHTYPCLATMNLDPATQETVMHASLYLLRAQVAAALARAERPVTGGVV